MDNVISEGCRIFEVHPRDLLGDNRFLFIHHARLAIYLALTNQGYIPRLIGERLKRDRTTVMSGAARANWLCLQDGDFAQAVAYLSHGIPNENGRPEGRPS